MSKRFYKYFPYLFFVGDAGMLAGSFLIAYFLRFEALNPSVTYGYALILALILWALIIGIKRDYKIPRTAYYIQTSQKAITSILAFLASAATIWVAFDVTAIDRMVFIWGTLFLLILLPIYRALVHFILKEYRRMGHNYRNAVIIGEGTNGEKLSKMFIKRPEFGIRFLGFFEKNRDSVDTEGSLEDFYQNAHDLSLDFIYVTDSLPKDEFQRLLSYAESKLIKVKLLPNYKLEGTQRLSFSSFRDIAIIDVNAIPLDNVFYNFLKRSFDIVFSLLVIVFLLSWLLPILAILIKMSSPGPVFFYQDRSGRGYAPFKCMKLRTMRVNAESDVKMASKNDQRVTKIGAFLRKTSLDELPQFFNVLMGDMSVVGPRPHPVMLNEAYVDKVEKFMSRHFVKPGVTGLAQAMGYRGEIVRLMDMRNRVKLDRFYIQNWSFILDIKIIFLTVYSIIFDREKAY
ncbi:undecaprenyl-phosphate glucose phosphotransferase [Penaeicola halotolerans]|uniref:undecaprenyl-phosphate glucose phosphotransferase n=1 Tax=Penaeicola halotolerans TaxID=2793196 RepID=UPI001CF86D23|nr:undecaprenyl-phosphate glucose phosphotransferase [Penaeicola halotolerans]